MLNWLPWAVAWKLSSKRADNLGEQEVWSSFIPPWIRLSLLTKHDCSNNCACRKIWPDCGFCFSSGAYIMWGVQLNFAVICTAAGEEVVFAQGCYGILVEAGSFFKEDKAKRSRPLVKVWCWDDGRCNYSFQIFVWIRISRPVFMMQRFLGEEQLPFHTIAEMVGLVT